MEPNLKNEAPLLSTVEKAELVQDLKSAIASLLEAGKDVERKGRQKSSYGLHERVSRKVFRRLLLRNAQLALLTQLTKQGFSDVQLGQQKGGSDKTEDPDSIKTEYKPIEKEDTNFRAYRHAITDLFVEKALTYLEDKADNYSRYGILAYSLGLTTIVGGISIAAFQYFTFTGIPTVSGQHWSEITMRFILGFTFYGFIVVAAVGLWRFGRAMLDQAERLLERRHALRQGRLFVHLHDGKMGIEDMEKAFNWNVSQPNAFSDMSTEAKAPWGTVLGEAIRASADVVKAGKNIRESQEELSD